MTIDKEQRDEIIALQKLMGDPVAVKALLDELAGYQQGATVEADAADEARAEVRRLRAENEALRKIISESATSCGAAVSVECSLEFMGMLPGEIASVILGLRKDAARLTWLDESQEVDSVGPTLCCGKHRATLREAIDAAMAMEARHG